MKLLSGDLRPDAGTIQLARGVRVARLTQDVPDGARPHRFRGDLRRPRPRWTSRRAAESTAPRGGTPTPQSWTASHTELDSETGWQLEHRVEEIIKQMGLDETAGGSNRYRPE